MNEKVGLIRQPFSNMPNLCYLEKPESWPPPPDDSRCFDLWDKYGMFPNVRAHSLMVACIATALAEKAAKLNFPVDVQSVRASALLHDLAKSWCIKHGGSHAMLGASWTLAETSNYGIAQGVMLHVDWPWQLPEEKDICKLPFFVMYADKRVKHAECVTIEDRYEDILVRYGTTEKARAGIRQTWKQIQQLEMELSKILEWDLDEYSFDCGGLVD